MEKKVRNIREILEELYEHPDYLYSHIWTVDDCMEDIVSEYIDNHTDYTYVDDKVYEELIDKVKNNLSKSDLIKLEGSLSDYYNIIDNFGIHWPEVSEMDWFKPVDRDFKINELLKNKDKDGDL